VNEKEIIKKALGILIHLSELSGRAKSQSKNQAIIKDADYYQAKREYLKGLIIKYYRDPKSLEKELSKLKYNKK
tara:strand:+ start:4334 stop:4555 length:222 start_codon:yes stop_codon:yes gene_type:complete